MWARLTVRDQPQLFCCLGRRHILASRICVIQICVMDNPFEFGRELGTDELVDRQAEVSAVIDTIRQSTKLFLIGPRRYGKTSILKTAEDRLAGKNDCRLPRGAPTTHRPGAV